MRAVRVFGDQSSAVERTAGAYAIRHCGCGPHHQGTAHAITLCAYLLLRVDLFLSVQETDVRDSVLLRVAWRIHRRHQWPDLTPLRCEVDVGGIRPERSLAHAIKGIRHQNGISLG